MNILFDKEKSEEVFNKYPKFKGLLDNYEKEIYTQLKVFNNWKTNEFLCLPSKLIKYNNLLIDIFLPIINSIAVLDENICFSNSNIMPLNQNNAITYRNKRIKDITIFDFDNRFYCIIICYRYNGMYSGNKTITNELLYLSKENINEFTINKLLMELSL